MPRSRSTASASPIGKQDQYIAAIGGITAFEFRPDGQVEVVPLALAPATRHRLEDNLLLFFTGMRRVGIRRPRGRARRRHAGARGSTTNLDAVKALGHETPRRARAGDLAAFGELLTRAVDR